MAEGEGVGLRVDVVGLMARVGILESSEDDECTVVSLLLIIQK